MKNRLKYIIGILLLLIILVGLAFIPIGDNIILLKHSNELRSIKLNADYEVLASDSKCGKIIGNGNGIQYFTALLIHSNETLKWNNNDLEGVFLININDDSFNAFIDEYRLGEYNPTFKKKLKEIKNTENYYVIYSVYCADLNYIWNSDLRAH